MATEKQITANRQNATKAAGPRTAAGKNTSKLNAVKHGLLAETAVLPGEDRETFETFAESLLSELAPSRPRETLLASEVVNLAWRLRRASLVEAGLFTRGQALADTEWLRGEQQELELLERDAQRRRGLLQLGMVDGDEVIDIMDESRHAELEEEIEQARAIARSDIARLADSFSRDAHGGDAFSKLSRYEGSIARRLASAQSQLDALQTQRRLELEEQLNDNKSQDAAKEVSP